MKRQDAIERYLSKSPMARTMVRRIMIWNPNKTLKENAAALNIGEQTARAFKILYLLPHQRDYLRPRGAIKYGKSKIIFGLLRRAGWSITAIADTFNIKPQAVRQVLDKL